MWQNGSMWQTNVFLKDQSGTFYLYGTNVKQKILLRDQQTN
jgi:hypothetical protein